MSTEFRLRRHIDRELELIEQSDLEDPATQYLLQNTAFDALRLAMRLEVDNQTNDRMAELYRDDGPDSV